MAAVFSREIRNDDGEDLGGCQRRGFGARCCGARMPELGATLMPAEAERLGRALLEGPANNLLAGSLQRV
jgi:hypothetical protein